MSIDRLRAHYGFSRMPFGKELAPGMLYRSKAHAEAIARISWLIAERAMGVITGEVGAGKTVAVRAATAALDASRHALIYLAQPGTGVGESTSRSSGHWVPPRASSVPTLFPKRSSCWPPRRPSVGRKLCSSLMRLIC